MAKIFIGNNNIGGGGIVPTNNLPTANETNYNKHELYLNDGELKYIDYSNSTYEYKTLASSDVVNTISFTITSLSTGYNGGTYQATEGMTWQEWVNSAYNTDSFVVDGSTIKKIMGVGTFTINGATPSGTITNGTTYATTFTSGGGGGN